ncbi:MAG: ExbD/TolR family protein [Saprospiraceae bacterium]
MKLKVAMFLCLCLSGIAFESCGVLSDDRDTFTIKVVSDDSILLNQKLVSIEELSNSLQAAKKRNPAAVNNIVELKVMTEDITMGTISDVKKALRQAEFLNVRFKMKGS